MQLLFHLNKNYEEHSTEFNSKKYHMRLIDYSYYVHVLINSGVKNVHLVRRKWFSFLLTFLFFLKKKKS